CHIHAYPTPTRLPDLHPLHLRSCTLPLPFRYLPSVLATHPSFLPLPLSPSAPILTSARTPPLSPLTLLLRSSFTQPPPSRHPPTLPPSTPILTFGPDNPPYLSPLSPPPPFRQVTTFHRCPVLRTQTPLVPLLRASVIVPTSDFDSTSVLVHCIGDLILHKHHCQYPSDFQPRLRHFRRL
ncbi:uncharacterized protein EI90DRAFT_3056966, partial [Cantharellus anzutake]|uniref:uncharacterized protein n=1 Tax=Cantharellus anzutake TaxID=1750568 RepID=UPI00190630A9